MRALVAATSALLVLLSAVPAAAEDQPLVDPADMPGPLSSVAIEQRLGEFLPLEAQLTDEAGQSVRLGDYFGEKPVLLAFVYYECPMLCTLIMNGVASSLSIMSLTPGEDFEVVAISIDHDETPEHARQAEEATLQRYGQPDTEAGWHFLTGDQETVTALAATAGFGFEYVPATDEWAHASAVMIATPEGQLSQYFYGVEYPPKDLRLAMVEASSGTIGSIVDQILLYCYRYDPQIGKYTVMTMRVLRVTGVLFSVGLILFMWVSFRRDRRASDVKSPTLGAA